MSSSVLNKAILSVAAGSMLALMTACGSSSGGSGAASTNGGESSSLGPNASVKSLYTQAKAEGKLTIYCAEDPDTCTDLGKAFGRAYPGITVNSLKLLSATLATRFTAEKKAHAPTADVLLASDFSFLSQANKQGLTVPWAKANVPGFGKLPKKWIYSADGDPFTYVVWGIAYNTSMVKASQAPKQWSALLNPRWKGKIVEPSCSVSTIAAVAWGTIAEHQAPGFLQKLAKQGMSENANGESGAVSQLAAGEFPIQAAANNGNVTQLKGQGAPLAISYPTDTTGPAYGEGLDSHPADPAAQRLFAAWLISPAGSKAMFSANPQSVSPGASPVGITSVPPDFKYFNEPYYSQVVGPNGLNCLNK